METEERLRALAYLAGSLTGIHMNTPAEASTASHVALLQVRDEIRGTVWQLEGYRVNFNELHRSLRTVRALWMTGNMTQDPNARCLGITGAGHQCRNRPMLGIDFCHVHASEEDKAAHDSRMQAWKQHVKDVYAKHAVDVALEGIETALAYHDVQLGAQR